MRLLLAPMEGVLDFILRDTLTQIGGIDQCVTEFMRVVDRLNPDHVFFKLCPELKTKSKTRAGTPIFFQILGGQPQPMAENALRAAELGAIGIDLNFGCPAKTVNLHDGGAALLKSPCRIYDVVKAVRNSVPKGTPVSVKMRLGFDSPALCVENAKAAEEGGAEFLTVHARTKTDGYRPPAYWEWIPKIREVVKIPVVGNGEIFNVDDYRRCREITGCTDFMIGRGAIANPYLFLQIKGLVKKECSWLEVKKLLPTFYKQNEEHVSADFARARTKQWLKSLSVASDSALDIFNKLKVISDPKEFVAHLHQSCR